MKYLNLILTIVSLFILQANGKDLPYTLDNAEKLRDADPRNFSIPRLEQRKNLLTGQSVKLIFIPKKPSSNFTAERIWVTITKAKLGKYVGTLDADSTLIEALKAGTPVHFESKHVISAILPEKYQIPYGKVLLISEEVVIGGRWPKFAKRENPIDEKDSGWRIYSNSTNGKDEKILKVTTDQIMNQFRVLDSILDEPDLQLWEWSEKNKEYRRKKAK